MSRILDAQGAPATAVKIAVALTSHEMAPILFTYHITQMALFTSAIMPEDVELNTALVSGTYVHSGRQQMLELLLKQGVTHILWLDSDMSFPKETLVRLMSHDVDFVGINYAQRKSPPDFVGIKRGSWHEKGDLGSRLQTTEKDSGLEECDALGFGALLMRTAALRDLPEDQPWFWYEKKWGLHIGEDVYFCRLLGQMGHKIYCDHDLSKECAHIGTFEYRTHHAETMNAEGYV